MCDELPCVVGFLMPHTKPHTLEHRSSLLWYAIALSGKCRIVIGECLGRASFFEQK
jgi:hypothetical protein